MKYRACVTLAFLILVAAGLVWSVKVQSAQANPPAPPNSSAFLPHIQSPEPTATPTIAPCSICSYDAYNCIDFDTQQTAQACFDYCYELTGRDVHRLDRDNDMLACEWLP